MPKAERVHESRPSVESSFLARVGAVLQPFSQTEVMGRCTRTLAATKATSRPLQVTRSRPSSAAELNHSSVAPLSTR